MWLLQVPAASRFSRGLPGLCSGAGSTGGRMHKASLRSSFLLNPLGLSSCPAAPLCPGVDREGAGPACDVQRQLL